MANRYSQIFTLTDIFNNKKLKGKIPLINYKEKELENGKISRTTNAKTVNRQIFDTATSTARPYYKPLKATRSGDILILDGELVGDHDTVVNAVYDSLNAIRTLLVWTANNADMIRTALKEAEKNKRKYGIDSKLFLRVQSMQEIEGMSQRQLEALMQNIMENIYYGDNFPQTRKKFNVENLSVKGALNYEQRRQQWKERVGAE